MGEGGSWMHQVTQPLAFLTLYLCLACAPLATTPRPSLPSRRCLRGPAGERKLPCTSKKDMLLCWGTDPAQIMCAFGQAVSSPVRGVGVYCKGGKVLSHFIFVAEVIPGFSHPTPSFENSWQSLIFFHSLPPHQSSNEYQIYPGHQWADADKRWIKCAPHPHDPWAYSPRDLQTSTQLTAIQYGEHHCRVMTDVPEGVWGRREARNPMRGKLGRVQRWDFWTGS